MVLSPQAILGGFTMTKWIAASVFLLVGACTSTTVETIEPKTELQFEQKTIANSGFEFNAQPEAEGTLDYGFCQGEGWGGKRDNAVAPARTISSKREVNTDPEPPNPDNAITVDFVKKDIHTVMHFIALRSGLKIIVDGKIEGDTFLPVIHSKGNALEVVRRICYLNNLIMVEDEGFVIITQGAIRLLNETNIFPANGAKYHVVFEKHPLDVAILEVAKVCNISVFVPDAPTDMVPVQKWDITLTMDGATPDEIFRKLAELGNMEIEPDTTSGYRFKYKTNKKLK